MTAHSVGSGNVYRPLKCYRWMIKILLFGTMIYINNGALLHQRSLEMKEVDQAQPLENTYTQTRIFHEIEIKPQDHAALVAEGKDITKHLTSERVNLQQRREDAIHKYKDELSKK